MAYQPIFLIGAARSGTKILRDTISTHPEIEKIDYDINFIWKRYNEKIHHDELKPNDLKPEFLKFINRFFSKKVKNKPYLIEKTVGNTLRISFLLKAFPDAKFIILYRDGRDVVESVTRQWGQAADNNYLLRKLLSIPIFQVLPFLFEYAVDTLKIKVGLSPSKKYIWGVRYKGWQKDLESATILRLCTKQWIRCIQSILKNKDKIKESNRIEIYYEDLVSNPNEEFKRIAYFLKLEKKDFNFSTIKQTNVGKSKKGLSNKQYNEIEEELKPFLQQLKYKL